MQVANTKNKCFTIWNNEIEGRLDAPFYTPALFEAIKDIKAIKSNYIKFGDIIEDLSGGATPKLGLNFYSDNIGIPFLRVQNITEEGLKLDDVKYITKDVHNGLLKRSQLKDNELVFTITGRIGSVAVVPTGFDGNINQHSVRIKLKKSVNGKTINPHYVAIFFNTHIGHKISMRYITGGTRPALDYKALRELPFILPPIQIQNKIVEIMRSAYDKKTDREQKAENLLNSTDDYILGELDIKMPEAQDKECFYINSQEVAKGRLDCYYYQPKFKEGKKSLKKANCKVEPLKNYITKIHYGASLKNNYVDDGIPLLRIQNLKPNKIILDDIVKISEARRKELGNAFVSENDLLISRSGSVGIVSVVPKEADGFAFGSFMIKFCLNDKIDKNFVSVWLNNKISQLFIKREKIGAIQGNITIETIENLQIPTPQLEIQKKLAGEIKERIAQANKLNLEAKNEIEKAKQEVERIILGK